jgi:hypothetical protein
VEFRILGPLELLEDGHQVVRHRTRALRARPARLARFIEEQRAPPGSTTFAPGRPAAHLGKFGDRVRGNSPDRPHAGETPASWQRSSPGARFDRPSLLSRTTGGSGTRHRLPFLNRTPFAGVPIPPLEVEIAAQT